MEKKPLEEMTSIERLFDMFACATVKPKPYTSVGDRQTVTVTLSPECMEILQVLSCRIGSTRAAVAAHILQIGCVEAAEGAGFSVDEKMRIPKNQKGSWDLTPKKYGFEHYTEGEEN